VLGLFPSLVCGVTQEPVEALARVLGGG
jgi:hypothetical protein